MALLRSLLNRSVAGLDTLSTSIHELEIQRSSESKQPASPKMSKFAPPPPVSASLYIPRAAIRVREVVQAPEELLALHREEHAIERLLQQLLDAQADGLTAGLTGEGSSAIQDDILSTGSSTPTVSTPMSRRESHTSNHSASQLRPGRKINLRGARKGISRAMLKLADLKAAEADILNEHLDANQRTLRKLSNWETKRRRLEHEIAKIESSDNAERTRAIQEEASKMQLEIDKLEAKLNAMKRKQRELLEEVAASESAVHAKLSSYKTSLAMLHADVAQFLKKPPVPEISPVNRTFFKLASDRRTLDMAREQWSEQQETLENEYMRVEFNREALSEGVKVWKDVVNTVMGFEATLRYEMSKPPQETSSGKGKQKAGASMQHEVIFAQMDDVISKLESSRDEAESKHWRLLVACIGAELEAFMQGRQMFRKALGLEEAATDGDVESNATTRTEPSSRSAMSRSDSEDMEDTARAWRHEDEPEGSEDESDPNLLLAHKDPDVD